MARGSSSRGGGDGIRRAESYIERREEKGGLMGPNVCVPLTITTHSIWM